MKTKNNIFLVEDDLSFGSVLKAYLEIYEYEIEWVKDGKDALKAFEKGEFDLCILDVMLPHIDGFQLAESIKRLRPEIPFIFLTAKTLKEDEVKGYQLGADDYIKKPFDSEILLFKLQAILNRNSNSHSEIKPSFFQIGQFRLNPEFRELINIQNNINQKKPNFYKCLSNQKTAFCLGMKHFGKYGETIIISQNAVWTCILLNLGNTLKKIQN